MFLGEEVPSRHRAAADIIRPALPDADRAALGSIPAVEWTRAAPQRKHWRRDAATAASIVFVVQQIDRGRGAVLLTDRVNVRGIRERLDICSACRLVEGVAG